jgi:predicted transposase YdaD
LDTSVFGGRLSTEAYRTAAQKRTEESYARGRAEGEAQGEAEGKAEQLIRWLGLRFGALSAATRAKILSAGPDHLDVWAVRVVTGSSLEEILGPSVL